MGHRTSFRIVLVRLAVLLAPTVLAACAPVMPPGHLAGPGYGPAGPYPYPYAFAGPPQGQDAFVTDYGGRSAPVARYVRKPDGTRIPFGPAPDRGAARNLPPGAIAPVPPPLGRAVGSGSAFAVSPSGLAVTNAHVVESCAAVSAEDGTPFRIVALDPERDLALLETGRSFPTVIRFRRDASVDLGETVLVFGFPYGRALGTGLNVTDGIVTGASGPGGDPTKFQMNAAVQPGNSGGPAVDEAGLLLGVAVGRLNDLEVLRATGTLPQGINFAVRANEVEQFLLEQGVQPVRARAVAPAGPRAVSAAVAPAVFQVICRA